MTYYAYVYAVTSTTGAVAVQASQQNNNAAIRANTSHINSTTTISQQSQTQDTGKKASSNPKDLKKTFMLVSNPYLLMLKVLKHSILKSEEAAEVPSLEGSNGDIEKKDEAGEKPSVEVPEKAKEVLDRIKETGKPPKGYKGGKEFANDGRGDGEVLPETDSEGNEIEYQEWDVNPKVQGQNRGAERIVTGSDGSSYYTDDHYGSFTPME